MRGPVAGKAYFPFLAFFDKKPPLFCDFEKYLSTMTGGVVHSVHR
jgi:hypothetical protein